MKTTIGLLVCSLVLGATHPTAADEPNYRAITVGAEAGTTGLGSSVSWRFSDNFGVRGGMNYFSYDTENYTYKTTTGSGLPVVENKFDGTQRLLSESIAMDFFPSAKSAFRISLGVLVNQNRFNATVQEGAAGSEYVLNGDRYPQSGVRNLELEVEQPALSPYLSVGTSIYLDKARHWSLSGELGVAYTGNSKVSLTAPNHNPVLDTPDLNSNTPFTDDLNAEEQSIQKDADDDKFYPIVKISVSYSF